MTPDLIGIVEAAYDVERSLETWLAGILAIAAPAIERGIGAMAYTYDASDPDKHHITGFAQLRVPEGLGEFFVESSRQMDAEYVRRSFYTLACGTASEVLGFHDLPFINTDLYQLGVRDCLTVNGMNPDGHGCALSAFQPEETRVSTRRRTTLAKIACHLAAAHRLRRRLESFDVGSDAPQAVLDHRGTVHHAEGEARSKRALRSLTESAVAITRARGDLRERAPESALEEWKGLIAARWTLVDVSEQDGRRYLVARQNEASTQGPPVLTVREQQVVELASMGHHNKLIAYNLGVSHSTVRVLIARAAHKLRSTSRDDLIERYARVPHHAE